MESIKIKILNFRQKTAYLLTWFYFFSKINYIVQQNGVIMEGNSTPTNTNKKNILVNINSGYVPYFLTMINSLATSNSESEFDVYIMHSNLTSEDKAKILTKVKKNINPIYIEMNEELFKGAPTVKRYPYEIYYRIFAPSMLPESVERILYLDSDLVVHANIDELYNMNFEGNLFIACTQIRSFLQWYNCIRLGVKKDYFYINTGVMVMNVKELRPLIDIDKIFKFIKRNGWRMCLYDQDVIFKFFGNRVRLIDPKIYNLSDRYITLYNMRRPKHKVNADWVENNNKIIHYLGRNKPWREGYKGILKGYYDKYKVE